MNNPIYVRVLNSHGECEMNAGPFTTREEAKEWMARTDNFGEIMDHCIHGHYDCEICTPDLLPCGCVIGTCTCS